MPVPMRLQQQHCDVHAAFVHVPAFLGALVLAGAAGSSALGFSPGILVVADVHNEIDTRADPSCGGSSAAEGGGLQDVQTLVHAESATATANVEAGGRTAASALGADVDTTAVDCGRGCALGSRDGIPDGTDDRAAYLSVVVVPIARVLAAIQVGLRSYVPVDVAVAVHRGGAASLVFGIALASLSSATDGPVVNSANLPLLDRGVHYFSRQKVARI